MNKIQKLEQWKKDLQAKIEKKEGEALAAKVILTAFDYSTLFVGLNHLGTDHLTTKLLQKGILIKNISQSAVCTF